MHDKQVRRRRAVLGLLVAVSLILLTAYFGASPNSPLHSVQRGIVQVFSPVQAGASKVLSPVRDVANWVSDTLKAKSQRDHLQTEYNALTFKYDKVLRSQPGAWLELTADQLWAAWRSVRCPVLLVRGEDSPILAAETAQRMVAENPNVSFASIPDCGHSITLDRPQGLLDALNLWLPAADTDRVAPAPTGPRG